MKLSIRNSLSNNGSSAFERLKENNNLRTDFMRRSAVSNVAELAQEYKITQTEVFLIRTQLERFNRIQVSSQARCEIKSNSDKRGESMLFISDEMNTFLTHGISHSADEPLTKTLVQREIVISAVSTMNLEEGKFSNGVLNQQLPPAFKIKQSEVNKMCGILNDNNVTSTKSAVDALSNTLKDNDAASAHVRETIMNVSPEVIPLSMDKGKKFILPAKSGTVQVKKNPEPFVKAMAMLTKKGSFAERCNAHTYGHFFGASQKYIDFVIDMRKMLERTKSKEVVIHSPSYQYALLLSRVCPDIDITYQAAQRKQISDKLRSERGYLLEKLPGLHVILKAESHINEKNTDIWKINREAQLETRSYYESKYRMYARKVKIFSVDDGIGYTISCSSHNGEVWETNYRNKNYTRDRVISKVSEMMINWYSFPWTRRTAYSQFEWLPDPCGVFDFRLSSKEKALFEYELADGKGIDAYLSLADGAAKDKEKGHRENHRKKEEEEEDEEDDNKDYSDVFESFAD